MPNLAIWGGSFEVEGLERLIVINIAVSKDDRGKKVGARAERNAGQTLTTVTLYSKLEVIHF